MSEKRKPGRPRTGPVKRSVSIYVSDEQIEYIRWWLQSGKAVPPKPWGIKKS